MDNILVLGVNHKVASVEARERLAFCPQRIPAALHSLVAEGSQSSCHSGDEVVLLSTCNRTEIYVRAENIWKAEERVRGFLVEYSDLATETLNRLLYVYSGEDATRHLLRVAAGLDSLVVGSTGF